MINTNLEKIIKFSTLEEYEEKKREAFKIIKNGIDKCIIDDEFEYNHMSHFTITPRLRISLPYCIVDGLDLFTKEKYEEWTWGNANTIMHSIHGFFLNLSEIGIWDSIYSQLTPQKMVDLIYESIIHQLDDEDRICGNQSCILYDVYVHLLDNEQDNEQE